MFDGGDARTPWCQQGGGKGSFEEVLDQSVAHARIVVRYDGQHLRVSVNGKMRWFVSPHQVTFDADDVQWISVTPVDKGVDVCVSNVEIWSVGPEQAAPVKSAAKHVEARREVVTNDALSKAPDMLRALRLGLEDCDVATMKAWVSYPLRADDGTLYENAAAQEKACLRGDATAIAPTVADVDAAIAKLTTSGDQITLAIGDRVWRLRWRKGQWWLTGVE
jgi:hypothetical protein